MPGGLGISSSGSAAVDPATIKLDDLGAPDDNTDRDVSSSTHGLFPKLPNTGGGRYWSESGTWTVPPGGSAAEATIVIAGDDATAAEKTAATASGGGVGDGTADEVQIQLGIDACTGTRWQTIKLVGSFSISSPIIMESYVILDASEAMITLAANSNCQMLTATSKNYFKILGGKWNGNKANQTATGAQRCRGFEFSSCTYFNIEGTEAYGFYKFSSGGGCPVYLSSCTDGVIDRNHLHTSGDSALTANGIGVMIIGNSLRNRVTNNNIHDCDGGVYLYGTTGQTNWRNTVSNNTIYNITRDGISLYNQDHVTGVIQYHVISNNTLMACGLDADHPGIVVGNHGPCAYNVIIGNTIQGDPTYSEGGIYVIGDHNAIINNIINVTVGGRGILIQDHVGDGSCGYRNIVKGNIVMASSNSGAIQINGGDYNLVEGNFLQPNASRGIWLDSACIANVIKGNTIDATGSVAIDVDSTTGLANVLDGNYIIAGSITDADSNTVIRFNHGLAGINPTDVRIDDTINSGDATTDGIIDAIRDALIAQKILTAS